MQNAAWLETGPLGPWLRCAQGPLGCAAPAVRKVQGGGLGGEPPTRELLLAVATRSPPAAAAVHGLAAGYAAGGCAWPCTPGLPICSRWGRGSGGGLNRSIALGSVPSPDPAARRRCLSPALPVPAPWFCARSPAGTGSCCC